MYQLLVVNHRSQWLKSQLFRLYRYVLDALILSRTELWAVLRIWFIRIFRDCFIIYLIVVLAIRVIHIQYLVLYSYRTWYLVPGTSTWSGTWYLYNLWSCYCGNSTRTLRGTLLVLYEYTVLVWGTYSLLYLYIYTLYYILYTLLYCICTTQ